MIKHSEYSGIGWHQYFIEHAKLASTKSKDRSTQVGAVIVGLDNEIVSTGFNGFPRGVDDCVESRHERPAKYLFTEHAERNAIFNAARIGVSTKGCTLYLNIRPIPCADCSRAVIQSGIKTIIGPDVSFTGVKGVWEESNKVSEEMLCEAGVELIVLHNEELVEWFKFKREILNG